MRYLPFLQAVVSYLIVAVFFMLLGAFLQWDSNFFFEEVGRER